MGVNMHDFIGVGGSSNEEGSLAGGYEQKYKYTNSEGETISDIFPNLKAGIYKIVTNLLVTKSRTTSLTCRYNLTSLGNTAELIILRHGSAAWSSWHESFYPITKEAEFSITQEMIDNGYTINITSAGDDTVRHYTRVFKIG